MDRPFKFRDPVIANAGPPKLDIWLEVHEHYVLLRARHQNDDRDQNLAAIRFDDDDGTLYLESIPLAPEPKRGDGDPIFHLRHLLGGRLIDLQPGVIADAAEPAVAAAGEA